MQSVTTNGKCRKVSPGCSKSRISEHSARSVSLPQKNWSDTFKNTAPGTAGFRKRSSMWPYPAKAMSSRNPSCLSSHTNILRKWDMAKPGNRCWSIHTMTRTTPTCISSPRELRRTERRLPMIMSAGVRRKSLTVSLERTGNRKPERT